MRLNFITQRSNMYNWKVGFEVVRMGRFLILNVSIGSSDYGVVITLR